MRETGILSITRCEHTWQVRYASFNPYDPDRSPYLCPNEGALMTLLYHWGIDTWSIQQAVTALRKGGVAVVAVVLSEAQMQTYFPLQRPLGIGKKAGGAGGQADPPQDIALRRDRCRSRANAAL
jgi:hypothetical protein